MRRGPAAWPAVLALAACAGVDHKPAGCDAAPAQRLVAQPATPALVASARRAAGASASRTITPGTMVTMEYRADRLTVTVDEADRVTAIRCG